MSDLCPHHAETVRLAARHHDPDTLDRLAADLRRACPECIRHKETP